MNSRRRLFWSLTGTYLAIFTGIAGLMFLLTTIAFSPPVLMLLFGFGSLTLAAALAALGTSWLFSGRISQEVHKFEQALQEAIRTASQETPASISGEQFAELAGALNSALQQFNETTTRQRDDL